MAKVKPDTMDLCDQRDMLNAHPKWKKHWDMWKNKHISAKDAKTPVDIVIAGIDNDGNLIAKLKYAKNETNFTVGWRGAVLNENNFILSNYIDIDSYYTFNFILE